LAARFKGEYLDECNNNCKNWVSAAGSRQRAHTVFFPGSKYANSIGVFNAWEKSKQAPELNDLVKYLVNWVAGTKIIFTPLLQHPIDDPRSK